MGTFSTHFSRAIITVPANRLNNRVQVGTMEFRTAADLLSSSWCQAAT